MNMKLKVLVGAAALAFAGAASAAISDGSGGSTDLLFVGYNQTSASTYLYDTGISFTAFSATTAQDFNLGSVAAGWSAFATSAGANLRWSVTGWDSASALSKFAATSNSTLASFSLIQRNGSTSAIQGGNPDGWVSDVNLQLGAATAGSLTGAAAWNDATWGMADNLFGATVNTGGTTVVTGKVGDQMKFFQVAQSSISPNSLSTVTQYGTNGTNYWTLTAGNHLVYNATAPVPEPSTWAMLIAGLMMVGSIARRRLS